MIGAETQSVPSAGRVAGQVSHVEKHDQASMEHSHLPHTGTSSYMQSWLSVGLQPEPGSGGSIGQLAHRSSQLQAPPSVHRQSPQMGWAVGYPHTFMSVSGSHREPSAGGRVGHRVPVPRQSQTLVA